MRPRRERAADLKRIIEAHGQAIIFVRNRVDERQDLPPFVYTIGNHQHGLPELLIAGFDGNWIGDILNVLGEIQRVRARAFVPGEIVDTGAKLPVRIVDAGTVGRDQYAVQVGVVYETTDFQVRQVLLSDLKGRWSDDPACEEPYSRQPILSVN